MNACSSNQCYSGCNDGHRLQMLSRWTITARRWCYWALDALGAGAPLLLGPNDELQGLHIAGTNEQAGTRQNHRQRTERERGGATTWPAGALDKERWSLCPPALLSNWSHAPKNFTWSLTNTCENEPTQKWKDLSRFKSSWAEILHRCNST
jgi:hypothetical protein